MEITIFSERAEYALGWTLLHSIWQITVLGLLLSIVLRAVTSPERRYWMAYGTLLMSLITGLLTYAWYFVQFDMIDSVVVQEELVSFFSVTEPSMEDEPSTWVGWLESQQSIVVQIWLIGFTFLAIRLAGGLWFLKRLRERARSMVFDGISIAELGARLGISRKVEAFLSPEIRMPIAFGWIKPVILLPAVYVNQLTPAEVEAILLHELSHIGRQDWLMNLVQAMVEAVFYFHPVLWWISNTIRMERERCCDELVVANMQGDRIQYARVLLQVQQLGHQALGTADPVFAMGLGATKGKGLFRRRTYLLERIQHILLKAPQQQSMFMERMIILGLFVATVTAWGLQAAPKMPTTLSAATAVFFSTVDVSLSDVAVDTIPPKGKKIIEETIEVGDRKIEVEMSNGQITKLKVNDKEILPSEYHLYPEVINRAGPGGFRLIEGQAIAPMGEKPSKIEMGDGKMILIMNDKEIPSEVTMRKLIIGNGSASPEVKFIADSIQVIRIDARSSRPNSFSWEELTENISEQKGEKKIMKVYGMKSDGLELDPAQIEKIVMEQGIDGSDGIGRLFSTEVEGYYLGGGDKAAFTKILLKELRRDFLVTDESNYAVELSPKKFKVNGKRQPDNMLRKYLKLYEDRMGSPMNGSKSIKLEVKM